MTKTNKTLWSDLETLAINYSKAENEFLKHDALVSVYDEMDNYIKTCVNNSVRNANMYGLDIPKADFESRILQYVWEALEAYTKGTESTFKNIVLRRIRFAETHTWRTYKTKGDATDKDGVSYSSARWDSLDRKVGGGDSDDDKAFGDVVLGDTVSAEDEYLDQAEEDYILNQFAEVNERYANVIRLMSKGYEGDDLAIASGEADSNNAKMRKLIQRAKVSFATFMKNRGEA